MIQVLVIPSTTLFYKLDSYILQTRSNQYWKKNIHFVFVLLAPAGPNKHTLSLVCKCSSNKFWQHSKTNEQTKEIILNKSVLKEYTHSKYFAMRVLIKAVSVQENMVDLELENRFRRKECATHTIFKLWFLIQVPDQDFHIPGKLPIVQTTVI